MPAVQPRNYELKDSRQLLIRQAEPDDAAAILEYVEVISRETDFISFGPGEFGVTAAEEADFLRDHAAADNKLYLVALLNGEIVGGLNFAAGKRPRTQHTGEFGMSVRRDFWGLGIGSRLLDALIDWAQTSGIVTKINLRVRTDNERALALYRAKGFILEGKISRDFRVNGTYFAHYWMGLEL